MRSRRARNTRMVSSASASARCARSPSAAMPSRSATERRLYTAASGTSRVASSNVSHTTLRSTMPARASIAMSSDMDWPIIGESPTKRIRAGAIWLMWGARATSLFLMPVNCVTL